MKKKRLMSSLLVVAMIFSLACPALAANSTKTDAVYEDAMDAYREFTEEIYHEDEWYYEIEAFALYDLNSDGIPELLTHGGGRMDYCKIFTYLDGAVEYVHWGTSFDVYSNGLVYYSFSGGAGYTMHSYYSLKDDLSFDPVLQYAEWYSLSETTYSVGAQAYEENSPKVPYSQIAAELDRILGDAEAADIVYHQNTDAERKAVFSELDRHMSGSSDTSDISARESGIVSDEKESNQEKVSVSSIQVTVNGTPVTWTDAIPFIDSNWRTMVPLRAVADALGLSVLWDSAAREAVFTDGSKTIYFPIDSSTARTGTGETVPMTTAAVIVDGRTYAPIRYLAEFFNYAVSWDAATKTAAITENDSDDERITLKPEVLDYLRSSYGELKARYPEIAPQFVNAGRYYVTIPGTQLNLWFQNYDWAADSQDFCRAVCGTLSALTDHMPERISLSAMNGRFGTVETYVYDYENTYTIAEGAGTAYYISDIFAKISFCGHLGNDGFGGLLEIDLDEAEIAGENTVIEDSFYARVSIVAG